MRIALVLALATVLGEPVEAHMMVLPARSVVGGAERYTLIVPTEGLSATVRVELRVPMGVEIMALEAKPGWNGVYEPFPIGAATLRWSGGRIPPGQMMSFDFLAVNPLKGSALTWSAVQGFEDGTSERYGEGGPPDHHASTTVLLETADEAAPPHGHGAGSAGPHGHDADDDAAPEMHEAGHAAADVQEAEHGMGGDRGGEHAPPTNTGTAPPASRDRLQSPVLWTALVALGVAVTALVVALRGGPRRGGS
jgi:uncharacterized protein YcnI